MTLDEVNTLNKMKVKIENSVHGAMQYTAYPSMLVLPIDFTIPEWEVLLRTLNSLKLGVKV